MQKFASSLLVSGFLHHFSHRMDIRCFLSGIAGQEDAPELNCYNSNEDLLLQ